MVYSVTNKKSFSEVLELRKKIERIKDSSDVPMVLVRTPLITPKEGRHSIYTHLSDTGREQV